MASDAQILNAAREVALALALYNNAKQERVKTSHEDGIALARVNAAQVRHQEAERRLLDLSRQKAQPEIISAASMTATRPLPPDVQPANGQSGSPTNSAPSNKKREKV